MSNADDRIHCKQLKQNDDNVTFLYYFPRIIIISRGITHFQMDIKI